MISTKRTFLETGEMAEILHRQSQFRVFTQAGPKAAMLRAAPERLLRSYYQVLKNLLLLPVCSTDRYMSSCGTAPLMLSIC